MNDALRQAAFVECVQLWQLLLETYTAWGGTRPNLSAWLEVTDADLDKVPKAYWIYALYSLLVWTALFRGHGVDPAWELHRIDTLMPNTAQQVARLMTTA